MLRQSRPSRAEILATLRANRGQLQYAHRLLREFASTQRNGAVAEYDPWAMAICAIALRRALASPYGVAEIISELIDWELREVIGSCTYKH